MIIKRQTRPLAGTRLAASREHRRQMAGARQVWDEVARLADQDRARGWPVKSFLDDYSTKERISKARAKLYPEEAVGA